MTVPVAGAIIILGWGRMRGRWLSEWLAVWTRHKGRSRQLEQGSDAAALLSLAHPGSRVSTFDIEGVPAAMIADGEGMVALLELGESSVIPSRAWHPLPSPASLLPAPAPDTPPVRIQLLLHSIATTGMAPIAASYRQLTSGRLLAGERAVLAIRVQRAEGWSDDDLERALSGAVRKVRGKLGGVPHRPLGEVAALRLIGEVSGHDGTRPGQEGWNALHLGGLLQTSYAVERWPQPHPDPTHALLPRLMRLPATMTTVSLTAGPWRWSSETASGASDQVPAQLVVRVATPDQASLGNAMTALRQTLAADQASGRRLDGEQMDGLMATLPLAGPTPHGLSPEKHFGPPRKAAAVASLTTPYGGSGLMIGVNRHQEPLAFRLFRPEATRIVVIGGVPITQIVAIRSMALGAHVLVQTTRPWAWEAFSRGLGPGAPLTVMAPGPVTVPPGHPLHPLLTIVDAGPVAADRSPGTPWHSTLVLRDDLSPVDVDVLGRADLALLQPLHPAEAAVAVSVLGLSRDQESWLARAQPGMVGVVHRRSVRWAALQQTQFEQQLIGSPNREARIA
ncbi:type VII secretion protein EccE [Allorhizocola rhizosphaerae]|uniref:type VII secretion protein EccE n=1 Tax=Allorhizocola rhizosphaerae TaxID=1872709 RepID=UPI0013C29E8C|nr:type VII secretion protein EccE [Allorhizocola rhizosphaerae]